MLAIIGAVVLICWLLGLTAFHVTAGTIHIALVVGIVLIATGAGDRKLRLPFGVFLAIGAVVAWFFGAPLVARYRALLPH